MPQLCAKGARARYNGWEDGAQGVGAAGEWANACAAVRGRAGDELSHRSKRGREQRENAPAVGKSARARYIINRRGAGEAGCRRETAARQRPLSPALRVSVPSTFLRLPTALLRPSAPPVCRFSPRISPVCAFLLQPTAFLLLCSRVVGSLSPHFAFIFPHWSPRKALFC